jgi:hypothetical protein
MTHTTDVVLLVDVIEEELLAADEIDATIGCSLCSDTSVSETRPTAPTTMTVIATIATTAVPIADRCDSMTLRH